MPTRLLKFALSAVAAIVRWLQTLVKLGCILSSLLSPLKWKLWYEGGTSFSNLDGAPEDAPVDGIQCVSQLEDVWGEKSVSTTAGGDFYIYDYDDDYWYRSDLYGLFARLKEKPLKLVVRFGKYIPLMGFETVRELARDDARTWLNGT